MEILIVKVLLRTNIIIYNMFYIIKYYAKVTFTNNFNIWFHTTPPPTTFIFHTLYQIFNLKPATGFNIYLTFNLVNIQN